ncbi:MAG: PilZ domain-containing protein [Xanthomonadales bacterium]|nr:PilZ domain-containing protein [Xanthomonadales bacterium]
MTDHEQRASSRRPCDEPAELSAGHGRWSTRLVNLSDGGACVLLPPDWPDLDPGGLSISFQLDGKTHRHACEIVWGDLERLGLSFLDSADRPAG